ncbi:hypothetical protein EPUS_05102 [Endocarpon pusillum Z07020]|uniref:Uncharacterized protein n=1 Tax=Endocarpon pusillum (strain Z07020 / HMAS-L-300199) TaxID=1263415 RepID=U1HKI8_ENDPU|nr:uncharacterized protein EPUS_05102 [Endocarpon pusillum Z07020]ERF70750.1 hypothetical protein EPUS_05102 [Endocarpon pusillum Z07020]
MQLPPFGPPLLDGDNAPTNEESDLIKRHCSELQHLLRDPRFRDSPLVMKLQENLSERALFTDYPNAEADEDQALSATNAYKKELEDDQWRYEHVLDSSRIHVSGRRQSQLEGQQSNQRRPRQVPGMPQGEKLPSNHFRETSMSEIEQPSQKPSMNKFYPRGSRAAGLSEMRLQPPIEVKMTKMGLDTKPSELRPLKSATSRENGIEITSEWAAQETPSRVGRSEGILFDRIISGSDPSITSSPKANAHAKAPSRSIDPKAVVAAQPDNGHPRIKYAPPLDARSATQVGTASSQPARQPQTKHQGQPAKPQSQGWAHANPQAYVETKDQEKQTDVDEGVVNRQRGFQGKRHVHEGEKARRETGSLGQGSGAV